MPAPGMIYEDEKGRPLLYVRSEQRPGASAPEHLFVTVMDRNVFTRWLAEVPEAFKVVNDVGGRVEAAVAWAEVRALEAQRDLLIKIMKVACDMVPDRAANELRQIYIEGIEGVLPAGLGLSELEAAVEATQR